MTRFTTALAVFAACLVAAGPSDAQTKLIPDAPAPSAAPAAPPLPPAPMPPEQQIMLQDQANQAMGQYPAIDLGYVRPLGMQQRAWTDPIEHMGEGQTRPAYSKYYWNPDLVLPIRVREGMLTLINFPEWELVEDVYIGDPNAFDGDIAAPNAILLNPIMAGADSNLIVFGQSGNRYVFYVRSESYNAERLTHSIIDIQIQAGARGASGGGGKGGGLQSNARITASHSLSNRPAANPVVSSSTSGNNVGDEWYETIPIDPSSFVFDLEVYVPNPEDAVIAPERVWRDEIFTYIDLGPKALSMNERPVVNLIVQGSESPVGFRTEGPHGRMIVVEAIGDLVLRNGARIVCIKQVKTPEALWAAASAGMPMEANYSNAHPIQQQPVTGPNSRSAGGQANTSAWSGFQQDFHYPIPPQGTGLMSGSAMPYGANVSDLGTSNFALELGTDEAIDRLETLWSDVSVQNADLLAGYQPYYTVDTASVGEPGVTQYGVPETFRLRVGPVAGLEAGDSLCQALSRRGVACSVVRIQ